MQSFMITLISCSVTMSALALFYMMVTPLLTKRYSAKGRYYAWLIIVMGLIIPLRPQFDNPFVKITPTNTTIPIIQAGNRTQLIEPIENALPSSVTFHISLSWWQIMAVVWLIGIIAFFTYHVVKHYRFMKMTRRWSERVTDEQTLSLFQNLMAELGISKQIDLYQSLSIGTPMLIGFSKPKILLPNMCFEEEELQFILTHELIHYRRKDLWYRCLVLLAKAIHWFNPLVHLMAKAIDTLCEISCDAEVVYSTNVDMRQQYSETIIGVVKYQSKMKTALSTNFYGGKKGMKKRITSIMDTSKKKAGITIVCCMFILTMGTGVAFAVSTDNPLPTHSNMIITDNNGIIKQSSDGGETWQPYTMSTISPYLEPYTVDEYEKLLADYKTITHDLVASDNLTQEQVDEAITYMESELEKLKADNGKGNYIIYKPTTEKTWVDEKGKAWMNSFGMNVSINDPSISYGGKFTLSDGNVIDVGTFNTKEEMLSATKTYCNEEVQAGRMSQVEVDNILEQLK